MFKYTTWINTTVDAKSKSESPVEIDGLSHYFLVFNHPFGGAGLRNHRVVDMAWKIWQKNLWNIMVSSHKAGHGTLATRDGDQTPPINAGWWYTYPSEKYESQLGLWKFPTEWKNKIHVPNYQPVVMRASLTPLVRWFNIPSFKIIAVVSQPSFGWWKNPILVGSQSAVSVLDKSPHLNPSTQAILNHFFLTCAWEWGNDQQ